MLKAVRAYFSEFGVLRTATRDFWVVNIIQFLESLAYFSMINVMTLYLTTNCGFSDIDSGAWVAIYTLYVTAFVLGIGSIIDVIGLRRSFLVAAGFLMVARLGMGIAPVFLTGDALRFTVMGMILCLSMGTAFMTPTITTSIRKFTTKDNRSTGFNMYYLIMNVGAILAGFAVTDGFRRALGEVRGNEAILNFGFAMALLCGLSAFFINEKRIPDPAERVQEGSGKRPIQIFAEVWKEKPFQRLVLFLGLTLGVRLVFTHQFLVMPKYYTRILHSDFQLGFANSINPLIIVVGLIMLIPVINRFSLFKLIVWGMSISALSLVFMALPVRWFLGLPGIHNLDQAFVFVIYAQILVFAFGELLFSPRFTEYISVVAPKDKVASYMSLSALPMFIAKPINGFISGILIAGYCYDGIRAKIDTANISFRTGPEYMWTVYLAAAVVSPIAVLLLRRFLTDQPGEKKEVAA